MQMLTKQYNEVISLKNTNMNSFKQHNELIEPRRDFGHTLVHNYRQ
jgi:hypothetical protein